MTKGSILTITVVSIINLMFAAQAEAKIEPKSIVGIWLFNGG